MKTTDYYNTFIAVAEDCPAAAGEVPPQKADAPPSVARMQFDLLEPHPYRYTSDDVLFSVYALKNGIPRQDQAAARTQFFSKSQACLRTSPLAKRYGWGLHADAAGKVAIYPLGSKEYEQLSQDKNLTQTKAMRSRRG